MFGNTLDPTLAAPNQCCGGRVIGNSCVPYQDIGGRRAKEEKKYCLEIARCSSLCREKLVITNPSTRGGQKITP